MTDVESLTGLMTQIGSMDDSIAAILRTAEDSWIVSFEDAQVEIEYEVAEDRLIFCCPIGALPTENRAEILEALLAYSFLWRSTGGVRIAMSGVGGEALQVYELAADKADTARLLAVTLNLVENTQIWRAFLASKLTVEPAAEQPVVEQMIRI